MSPSDRSPADQLPAQAAAPRLCVISAANTRYFPGLVVTLHSLLTHLAQPWAVDFKVLTDDLDEGRRVALQRALRATGREHTLETIDIDLKAYAACPELRGSKLAYARLLLPELIATDHALYVDSDVVVLKDVSRLTELPWPAECLLYAVNDTQIPTVSMEWEKLPYEQLGIPAAARYFNSGFVWFNLAAWRRQGIGDACRAYMDRFPGGLQWHDQSVLNAVLWNRWSPLERSWNLAPELTMGTFELYPLTRQTDVNIHYTGRQKPWSEMHPLDHFYRAEAARVADHLPGEVVLRQRAPGEKLRQIGHFVRRACWHYGGFCKRSARKLLPRRSHHSRWQSR